MKTQKGGERQLPTRGEVSSFILDMISAIFPSWMLETPWDHVLHFSVSFIGVVLLFALMRFFGIIFNKSITIAVLTVLFLGFFKEFYVDLYAGTAPVWDYYVDIAANFLGVGLAAFLIFKRYKKSTSD